MAKISDLTAITTIADNHVLVINDGTPTTKKITVADFKTGLGVNYTKLVGLLTQSGTNAPTLTILENTTGATITPSRLTTGAYTLTFDSAVFNDYDKVHVMINNFKRPYAVDNTMISSTEIQFQSWVLLTDTATDGALKRTAFEIRIYE